MADTLRADKGSRGECKLSYTLPLGGITVRSELGYEMHNYMQLVRTATTVTRGPTTFFFSGRDNFGLWGPYSKIEVSF